MTGKVFLVGAGPGDPELLTLKAARVLAQADVVVYDRLVNKEILDLVPGDCERIYAGKRKHLHTLTQDEINSLLVTLAGAHETVVRLKGGDPFIFGRGGEEIDELVEAGIEWEVVPGITAASGAAASVGLPLTYRQVSHAVTYVTAHKIKGVLEVDWDLVLHDSQTVVFYMGLSVLEELVSELQAKGKPAMTPFSVIANATRGDEALISGTLGTIVGLLEGVRLPSPALLVMGPVPRKGELAATPFLSDAFPQQVSLA